jgi:hypothetical protein
MPLFAMLTSSLHRPESRSSKHHAVEPLVNPHSFDSGSDTYFFRIRRWLYLSEFTSNRYTTGPLTGDAANPSRPTHATPSRIMFKLMNKNHQWPYPSVPAQGTHVDTAQEFSCISQLQNTYTYKDVAFSSSTSDPRCQPEHRTKILT